ARVRGGIRARSSAAGLHHGVPARVQIDPGDRVRCSARRLHGVSTQRLSGVHEAVAAGLGRTFASCRQAGPGRGRQSRLAPRRLDARGRSAGGTDMSMLAVDGVSISFGGVRALDSVSATFRAGEIVGVIGPNGAGKTTLLNVICGLDRPDAGEIRLEDRVITGLKPNAIAGMGLARTFQTSQL